MRTYCTLLLILFACSLQAQQDTTTHNPVKWHPVYERHAITATACVGFFDAYRYNYSVPSGFTKNNTSGFAPILVKLEYGFWKNVSVAATFSYDAFIYNFNEVYMGNNGPFTRYKTDAFRSVSGGITAFYHLNKLIHVPNLDPFIGAGLSLNNVRYSAYPSGDTVSIKLDHTVTPYLKVGAHYYISDQFSVFGDLGYDKSSIFSVGFSCRFFGKKPLK